MHFMSIQEGNLKYCFCPLSGSPTDLKVVNSNIAMGVGGLVLEVYLMRKTPCQDGVGGGGGGGTAEEKGPAGSGRAHRALIW